MYDPDLVGGSVIVLFSLWFYICIEKRRKNQRSGAISRVLVYLSIELRNVTSLLACVE